MKIKKKSVKKSKRFSLKFWLWLAFSFIVAYVIFFYSSGVSAIELYSLQKVDNNYGDAIDSAAVEFDISSSYLKALAMLECSGRVDLPSRYEPHIYSRLRNVKSGKRPKYETLTHSMVKSVNEEALKNLATSWGPFQIMGYKCVQLGIFVHHLRGNDAVYWGAKWIDLEYGSLLRAGRYKDAFHFHNTGKYFPKSGVSTTYDPDYVNKGLHYMKYFENYD